MTVTRLDHVNIRGHRALLDALRDFYCDILGLTVGPRPAFPMFGYWLYAGEQPLVHLYESLPDEQRTLGRPATMFDHFAFRCRDPDAVLAVLTKHGVDYDLTGIPGTDIKQIFLVDPAGNRVELQFTGK